MKVFLLNLRCNDKLSSFIDIKFVYRFSMSDHVGRYGSRLKVCLQHLPKTDLLMFSSETGQALNTERNPLYLASLWLDEWAAIVNADVQMHDESALSFLERQTESPLFQVTAFRHLLAILKFHKILDLAHELPYTCV